MVVLVAAPRPAPTRRHMPERKQQTNLRLTPQARRILDRLSRRWGISQADVMELLLRQAAEQRVPPLQGPSSPPQDPTG